MVDATQDAAKQNHSGSDQKIEDAVSLARSIARGERSAREVLKASIERVSATDGQVNAFTDLTLDRARAKADAIDAQRARGEALPPWPAFRSP